MDASDRLARTPTGRYSPLRYPGGKGKLATFVRSIIRENGLSDGRYVEPYAGGAAIAWELLLTGIVRRVSVNDISRPVYCFWDSVLHHTEELCRLINDRPVTVAEWDRQKAVFKDQENATGLQLAFAFFFLNRTNRSGILNGGIIGGRNQTAKWKIDARFNKSNLISRIEQIAQFESKIELTSMDAIDFLKSKSPDWGTRTLIYLDPPYYEKGRFLYYDAYREGDHTDVAKAVSGIRGMNWIVSYDDVRPIHDLYEAHPWIQYSFSYSARNRVQGREAMFFSSGLRVPDVPAPLIEMARGKSSRSKKFVPSSKRKFVDVEEKT